MRDEVAELERRIDRAERETAEVRERTARLRARLVVRIAHALVRLLRDPAALLRRLRRGRPGDESDAPSSPAPSAGLRLPPPSRRRRHPHLRVGHLGVTRTFEGSAAHVDPDDPDADLLLVEPPVPGDPSGGVRSADGERPRVLVLRDRRGLDLLDLGFDLVTTDDPSLAERAAARLGEDRTALVTPAVDPATFNPRGWHREPPSTVMIAAGRAGDVGTYLSALRTAPTVVVPPEVDAGDLGGIPGSAPVRVVEEARDLAAVAREHRAALAHPALHPSHAAFVRHVLALVACGTPVIHPPDAVLEDLLPSLALHPARSPAEVTEHLDDLAEPSVRERRSIVGREHVLTHHTVHRRFDEMLGRLGIPTPPEPTISVLLSTHRPESLDHAHAQIARQTYPSLEIITVCHGDGFDDDHVARLNAQHDHPTVALHAPSRWPLGDALNLALDHATGELVTKMDDDDLYGPDHLRDLHLALSYSGADVVGKLPNFIYLSGRDLTISRYLEHEERDVWHLPGATILTHRETLAAFRFSRVPRGVDTALYERLHPRGAGRYSTHRYNFVRFRGTEHTYTKAEEEFLEQAEEEYPGLAEERTMTPPIPADPPTVTLRVEGPAADGGESEHRAAARLEGRWPPGRLAELERRADVAERELARARHELRRLRGRRIIRLALLAAEVLRHPWRLWRLPTEMRDALRPDDVGEEPPPIEPDEAPSGVRIDPAGQRTRYPHLRVAHVGAGDGLRGLAGEVVLDEARAGDRVIDETADLVVVEPPVEPAELAAALEGAAALSAPVVLVARGEDDLELIEDDEAFAVVVVDGEPIAQRAIARVGRGRVLIGDDPAGVRLDRILEHLGMPIAQRPRVSVIVDGAATEGRTRGDELNVSLDRARGDVVVVVDEGIDPEEGDRLVDALCGSEADALRGPGRLVIHRETLAALRFPRRPDVDPVERFCARLEELGGRVRDLGSS